MFFLQLIFPPHFLIIKYLIPPNSILSDEKNLYSQLFGTLLLLFFGNFPLTIKALIYNYYYYCVKDVVQSMDLYGGYCFCGRINRKDLTMKGKRGRKVKIFDNFFSKLTDVF